MWIEIIKGIDEYNKDIKSLPARGVWIEILRDNLVTSGEIRHSPRGECGLKLIDKTDFDKSILVTPREGSVD